MPDTVTQLDIEDIFGIPRVNRDIQDDDSEEVVTGDKSEEGTPFEAKIEDVSKAIKKAVEAPETQTVKTIKEEPKKVQNKSAGGMFDDLFDDEPKAPPAPAVAPTPSPAQLQAMYVPASDMEVVQIQRPVTPPTAAAPAAVVSKPVEVKKAPEMPVPEPAKAPIDFDTKPEPVEKLKIKLPPKKKEEVADLADIEEEESDEDDAPLGAEPSSEEGWRLKSPAPKYNRFYAEKSLALGKGKMSILPGGEIDFAARQQELAELNCDIAVQTNDLEGIHQKMQYVQNLRERCKQIQLHTTQQYYLWERYIELFHGVLTRIEYARGKQEGINFEHMSDMEHYFQSLKSLHRGADQVMRTLDGAFECLSRQVTIALPMKDIERHGSSNPAPRQISPEQKKYDALGAAPQSSKSASNTSGMTSW